MVTSRSDPECDTLSRRRSRELAVAHFPEAVGGQRRPAPAPRSARVQSLQKVADYRIGDYSRAVLQANLVLNPEALLALRVNGVDPSPDHGYPARIIVPGLPGVHNTKWVSSIDVQGD